MQKLGTELHTELIDYSGKMTEDFLFNNPRILSSMTQEMLLEGNDQTNTSDTNTHAKSFITALTSFHSLQVTNTPELELYVPQPGENIN